MGKIWRGWGWGNIYGDGVGMEKNLQGRGGDGVNFFYRVILYTITTIMTTAVVLNIDRTGSHKHIYEKLQGLLQQDSYNGAQQTTSSQWGYLFVKQTKNQVED